MFYIDTNEDLIDICNEISNNTNIIAIDTEFRKQKEYFPTLSIIQIAFFNGEIIKSCIIDVLAENISLEPFFKVLSNNNIKKVFHACNQDLEGLYKLSGEIPSMVEDTQIMAEFCGMKANLSYVDLVKETLKVSIKKNKKIQVSDWMKRPLTETQLKYASGDVDYLLEIYIYLAQKLDKNKNFKLYREEMKERHSENMMENIARNSWKKMRFKLGNKTNIYIELLKELAYQREKIAMENNIVKNEIVPDNFLKTLIAKNVKTLDELNEVFSDDKEILSKPLEIKEFFLKIYNDKLAEISSNDTEEKPYTVELKNKAQIQKLENITDYIIARCKQLNINPELAQNKIDIISFLTDSEKINDLFCGWKFEIFGSKLKEIKNR